MGSIESRVLWDFEEVVVSSVVLFERREERVGLLRKVAILDAMRSLSTGPQYFARAAVEGKEEADALDRLLKRGGEVGRDDDDFEEEEDW